MNPIEVVWVCPDCGQMQSDYYRHTAIPVCKQCGKEFFWDQITDEPRMKKLNDIWEEAIKKGE